MRDFIKCLGVAGAIVMALASISPQEAGSKLSAWAKLFGWESPPQWLTVSSADNWVFWIGFILLCVALVWFVWPAVRSYYWGAVQSVSCQYSIEELKGIKGVLQGKVAAGTQLSLHASHQSDVSTSSTRILDLVNLSVDISPDTPFWLTCNVHKERKRNVWFGIKLNDIYVNRVDGEHVMEDDMST